MMDSQLQIAYRKTVDLVPYARNTRKHTEKQIGKVMESIREFGFTNPILVDGENGIIAGHCRLAAAQKLGMGEVPTIELAHLSDAQRRAYVIADNRLAEEAGWEEEMLRLELGALAEMDFDIAPVGFSDREIAKITRIIEEAPELTGEGEIPVPGENAVSRTGDIWRLGSHRLMCADATSADDVKRLMQGERGILFATDPPYLVEYDGSNHPNTDGRETRNRDWSDTYGPSFKGDRFDISLYERFVSVAVEHAIDPYAAWYCWHASKRQLKLEAVWREAGAFVHQQIIWKKDRPVLTHGHYLYAHEPCFFGWVKGNRPPILPGRKQTSTVWELTGLDGGERPDHPTPKPLECFSIPMLQHVGKDGLCYEPFSGSGTQIMAGEMTGRRVYAMEISPVYVDLAVRRWEKFTGKNARLAGSGETFSQTARIREG